MNNFITALLIVIGLTIATAIGFYVEVYQPIAEETRGKLEKEVEEAENKLKSLEGIKKQIDDLKKDKEEQERLLKKVQTGSLEMKKIVPRLLDSTEAIANKFRVKFQDIRISPLVRAENWSELPVEMTVLGTYNDISCFLNVMEARKIINLAAGSMNVAVSSEVDKDNKKSPMLSVTLSAKVFILSKR